LKYRFCYIEFANKQGAENAVAQDESLFKGRLLTVHKKRKNIPGRGRGGRKMNMNNMMQSMMTMMMGRGGRGGGRGGMRGRGRGGPPRGGMPPGQPGAAGGEGGPPSY
jgi:polyadenylate-binding protein 2